MKANTKIHTLMIVENLSVPFDRRVWQEARTLRAAGHDVTIICPTGHGHDLLEEEIESIRIFRHKLPMEARSAASFLVEYGSALLMELQLAIKIWRQKPFQIVHVANPPDLLFLVALPFKLFGVKLIFDHHDLTPELYFEKFNERGIGYLMTRAAERLSFLFCDAVISTNVSYRQIALERGGKDPSDVFIVRSGPDLTRMRIVEPHPAIREKAAHIIGYVGIMGKQDGIDVLLRAASALVHGLGRKDVHFLLIGDGPELEDSKTLAVKLELSPCVTFTGYLRDEALHRALSSIDIGLCPDPCNEYTTRCTMNKIMEYMAFGKPIVQFDLVEGRFSAGEASLYAEPGNIPDLAAKLDQLIADPQRREQMGRLGRERLERHLNWSIEAPRLLSAYDRVIGEDVKRPMIARWFRSPGGSASRSA